MSLDAGIVVLIIWVHFLSDFILQTDKMATLKSESVKYLGLHCFTYSLSFFLFGWKYALVNGACHFIVDFITSRITKYFWAIEDRHNFFVTIGCDQAIHITILILTMGLIGW